MYRFIKNLFTKEKKIKEIELGKVKVVSLNVENTPNPNPNPENFINNSDSTNTSEVLIQDLETSNQINLEPNSESDKSNSSQPYCDII